MMHAAGTVACALMPLAVRAYPLCCYEIVSALLHIAIAQVELACWCVALQFAVKLLGMGDKVTISNLEQGSARLFKEALQSYYKLFQLVYAIWMPPFRDCTP